MIDLSIKDETYEDIELLIFDKDGTLFKLYPYCSKMVYERTNAVLKVMENNDQAFKNWLVKTMGVNLEEEKIYPQGPIGVYSKYYAQNMLYEKLNKDREVISREMLKEAFKEADENINEITYLKTALIPVPGMVEFIRKVQGHCKCAIFSNDMTQRLKDSMEIFGIGDCFGYILGGDLMEKHKPDPEGVIKIMEKLGVEPENTALFGDSKLDVESGHKARCKYIFGVISDISDLEYLKSNSNVSVNDFNQIKVMK
jgi:HAD superfamily hydrolase (TIGR01549 family)